MVTKQAIELDADKFGSVLAKILMVAKLNLLKYIRILSSVLAKILMVTKLFG